MDAFFCLDAVQDIVFNVYVDKESIPVGLKTKMSKYLFELWLGFCTCNPSSPTPYLCLIFQREGLGSTVTNTSGSRVLRE